VLCGPPSSDLVAIDIDTDDPEIADALRRALPATPAKKKGARGETWFYRGPGVPSRDWVTDGGKVQIIGPGRQTVLPPTIHPDLQRPYRWTGLETLEDLRPRDLPLLPVDVIDRIDAALAPFGFTAPEPREPSDADTPHRRFNEEALANLAAWVPHLKLYNCRPTRHGFEAVPTWRPSSTGRDDRVRKRNLKIAPHGIRDFGAGRGFTPIDLVMTALDYDLDAAFTFLCDRIGWSAEGGAEDGEAKGDCMAPAHRAHSRILGCVCFDDATHAATRLQRYLWSTSKTLPSGRRTCRRLMRQYGPSRVT
jgi:hypothetical protein